MSTLQSKIDKDKRLRETRLAEKDPLASERDAGRLHGYLPSGSRGDEQK